MNLHESRMALLDAVNAHDIDRIKSFIDPSYAAKGLGGVTVMGYGQISDYVAQLFAQNPDYRETLEIETEEVRGDTGRLTTRREETFRTPGGMERTKVSRQVETWKPAEGRWVIVGEQAISAFKGNVFGNAFKGLLDSPGPPRRSLGLVIGSAVVLAASFLPWCSVPVVFNLGGVTLPVTPFGDLHQTVTGWNGHLRLPGVELPNWLLVLGAVAVAVIQWRASRTGWTAAPLVNLGITIYGVLHLVAFAFLTLWNRGTIQVGLLVTLGAYGTFLYLLLRSEGAGKPAGAPEV